MTEGLRLVRHAFVTGIGIVSPIGGDPETFLAALRDARSGIGPIRAFDASPFRSQVAGEVHDFDPATDLSPDEVARHPDRYLLLALVAARRALAHAGLPGHLGGDGRTAIAVGTCNGGLRTGEALWRILLEQVPGPIDPARVRDVRNGTLGVALAATFGIGGPCAVVTTACASSTNALGTALDLIRDGEADRVLVGGSDALCLTTCAGFSALKALASPGPCRPFSGEPAQWGMTLGEGAAFWVLEADDLAARRGAIRLGEVVAYGLSGDAHHATSPDPAGDGAYRAMRAALDRAGVPPADLGAINAHGTGTEANDRAESRAIRRLLDGAPVPVSSTKSFLGHALGAAGILEATAALLSMNAGFVPPTLRFDTPRPGVDIDPVPNAPRDRVYDLALSNSFGFAGNNASVLLRAADVVHDLPAAASPRTVAITGVGAVTPLGLSVRDLVDALDAGRHGVASVTRFDVTGCRGTRAGLVPDFDPRRQDRRLDLAPMSPIARFAALAAREALDGAAMPLRPRALEPVGLVLGTHAGPSEAALMRRVWTTPSRVADVNAFAEVVPNSVNGQVSIALYLKGHNTHLSPGQHAGGAALVAAARAIRDGHAASVLAGAADQVSPTLFRIWNDAGWVVPDAPDAPSPRTRTPAEGAVMLLVEHLDAAVARDVPVLATVAGWAECARPSHGPDPDGDAGRLEAAIRLALRRAGWTPSRVAAVVRAPLHAEVAAIEDRALDAVLPGVPHLRTDAATGTLEGTGVLVPLAALLARRVPGLHLVVSTSEDGAASILALDCRGPA